MKRAAKLSLGQGQLMLWILVGCVLAVAVMLVFFKVTGIPRLPVPREVPRIEWMPSAAPNRAPAEDERYVAVDLLDPSLMSLPSRHGFSKEVWDRKSEAKQRDLGWNEQPAYLSLTLPEAPRSLLEPVPLDAAILSAADKTPAEPEQSEEESMSPAAVVNQTVIRVLGPLESRSIIRMPELPVITNSISLRPAQVRIGVGSGGLVRYSSLDRSSGSDSADAEAVALAQQMRFESNQDTATDELTWGIVRFLWATQAPATTNAESEAATSQ